MEHYLQSFRDDFLDVTLACEDVQQIGTHKVILLASSPLDRKMGIQLQVNSTTKWTQLQSGLNYKVDLTTKWTQLQSRLNCKVDPTTKWTQLQISPNSVTAGLQTISLVERTLLLAGTWHLALNFKWIQLQSGLNYKVDSTTKWTQLQSGPSSL